MKLDQGTNTGYKNNIHRISGNSLEIILLLENELLILNF